MHISTVQALQESQVICHNHTMTLFHTKIGFPFATYAIHEQSEMERLAGGRKDFVLDPSLPHQEQHATNDTIFKSPYSRGHLTPSYIMSYDKTPGGAWEETYYMTNILPQVAVFNEGPWARLEMNIVQSLLRQPAGTIWEIYTGGFWNGAEKLNAQPNDKDYLWWKALCDRKKCLSGLITAYFHADELLWDVVPVSNLIPGLFDQCCPWNKALDQWKSLLEGVSDVPWPIS